MNAGRSVRGGVRPHVLRPHRRASRGQAIAVVALGGIALISIVGLALDGGYEVAKFRQAQNGGDAGALAVARKAYLSNNTATSSSLCSTTSGSLGVGPYEMLKHNGASSVTCGIKSKKSYAPTGSDGFQSYGALSTIDSEQNVGVPLVSLTDLKTRVGVNETTAGLVNTGTPAATGSVDLASLQATASLLGAPVVASSASQFTCSSSATGLGNSQTLPVSGGTCPTGSLALSLLGIDVDAALGLSVTPNPGLILQSTSSSVPTVGPAQARDSSEVVNATVTQTGVTLGANVGDTLSTLGNLGGDVTGAQTTVSLADVAATVAGIGISLKSIQLKATASYSPSTGFVTSMQCSTGIALGAAGTAGGITVNGSITVSPGSGCAYTPVGVSGVLSINSCYILTAAVGAAPTCSGTPPACTASGTTELCSIDYCLMNVSVLSAVSPLSTLNVCLGRVRASAHFDTTTSAITGAIVTDEVDSPAFFLHLLGWQQTKPTATAAAAAQQITDISSAAFSLAPYAVNYLATEQSVGGSAGPGCSQGTYAPLVPGCYYAVYGSSVDDNQAANTQIHCAGNGKCWHGQLASASAHAVGSTVTFIGGTGTGPQPVVGGGQYVLLPVVNFVDGTVRSYGLFKSMGSGIYQLMNTPSQSSAAPLAQSESAFDWLPGDEGAAAVKLVDPSHFSAANGWS